MRLFCRKKNRLYDIPRIPLHHWIVEHQVNANRVGGSLPVFKDDDISWISVYKLRGRAICSTNCEICGKQIADDEADAFVDLTAEPLSYEGAILLPVNLCFVCATELLDNSVHGD